MLMRLQHPSILKVSRLENRGARGVFGRFSARFEAVS